MNDLLTGASYSAPLIKELGYRREEMVKAGFPGSAIDSTPGLKWSACTRTCTCTCTHTHTRAHTYTHTHIRTHIPTHTHVHTCARVHTHMHTYECTGPSWARAPSARHRCECSAACLLTYLLTYVRTYLRTYLLTYRCEC